MAAKVSPPYFLAILLAFIPSIGALSWLLLGSLEGPRNQSVIDLLPIFQMLVIFWAVLFGMFRTEFLKRPPPLVLYALIALIILMGLGFALNAIDPIAGLSEIVLRLVFIFLCVSLIFLIQKFDHRLQQAFSLAIFIFPILHFPVLLILYFLYIDHSSMNWLGGPVGFEHVRLWGMMLAVSIANGLGLLSIIRQRSLGVNFAIWAMLALLFAMLFWSGSRGALVGLIAAYIFSLAVFWRQMKTTLLPAFITAILGATLSLLPQKAMFAYGLLDRTKGLMQVENAQQATGGRMSLWRDAVDLIKEHPFIGHGFDQFRYLSKGWDIEYLQVHSIVLQTVLDVGIIGAVCVIVILLFYWLRGLTGVIKSRDPLRIAALTATNAILAMSLFDGTLYHPETTTLFAVVFALVLATPRPVVSPAN